MPAVSVENVANLGGTVSHGTSLADRPTRLSAGGTDPIAPASLIAKRHSILRMSTMLRYVLLRNE